MLVVFMCVTLLLASLLCLTLPGKSQTQAITLYVLLQFSFFSCVILPTSPSSFLSMCGSLADVFLDGQCYGARAVHSS